MAESKTVAVVPLSNTNYSTWKVQCKMALIKEGLLWNIVNGTETEPEGNAERRAKFVARRDRALATIVLAMEPSLLYLVGSDPTDPVVVWRALADQFQQNTWANKLELKRKLFSLRLAEGGSVQQHIKSMSEICDELSAIGETVSEEDRVVYLLASLPESYSVLVTALEANANVPSLAVVRERLLHEESKVKNKPSQEEALAVNFKKKLRSHFCNKPGHFKRDCEELAKLKGQAKPVHVKKKTKMGAFKVTFTQDDVLIACVIYCVPVPGVPPRTSSVLYILALVSCKYIMKCAPEMCKYDCIDPSTQSMMASITGGGKRLS